MRVELVEVAALPEAGEGLAVVHDHVGARRVLHPASGAPAVVALGLLWVTEHARPQRLGGLLLGEEPVGAHEAVAVAGSTVGEGDLVHHAVAVEGVVLADRRVDRVLGVAEVDAVEIAGKLTGDDGQVVGVPLGRLWSPRPGAIRMVVVVGQRGEELADHFYVHCATPWPN